jgi:hypothetical protein
MDTTQKKFSFDIAAVWALAITIGLSAIVLIPSATIPFLYTKVSLLAIGAIVTLALFILARLTRGNIIVPPALLLGAVWFVPIAYALSTLFSGVSLKAAIFGAQLESDTFGFMVLVALLASLTALVLRRREHIQTFYLVLMAAFGIVVAGEVVFLIWGQSASQTVSATANLIGSFTDVGMLMGFALTLGLLALRFLTISNRLRIGLLVAGAVELFVLALVNSNITWILVGLVALGIFIEAMMRRTMKAGDDDLGTAPILPVEEMRDDAPRSLIAPLVVLAVSFFFLIGGSTIGNALTGALHASSLDVRPSWAATFAVGGHTYASSPIFRHRPGHLRDRVAQISRPSLNDTIFWTIDFTSGIGFVPTSLVTTGAVGSDSMGRVPSRSFFSSASAFCSPARLKIRSCDSFRSRHLSAPCISSRSLFHAPGTRFCSRSPSFQSASSSRACAMGRTRANGE